MNGTIHNVQCAGNSGRRAAGNSRWPTADMLYLHITYKYTHTIKTGQPMAAVRFPDMQGKSLCMAISSYLLRTSPKKTSPAAARRRCTVIGDFLNGRTAAGEVLARGGLEGTASPKEAAPPRSSPFKVFSLQGLLPRQSTSPSPARRRAGGSGRRTIGSEGPMGEPVQARGGSWFTSHSLSWPQGSEGPMGEVRMRSEAGTSARQSCGMVYVFFMRISSYHQTAGRKPCRISFCSSVRPLSGSSRAAWATACTLRECSSSL